MEDVARRARSCACARPEDGKDAKEVEVAEVEEMAKVVERE